MPKPDINNDTPPTFHGNLITIYGKTRGFDMQDLPARSLSLIIIPNSCKPRKMLLAGLLQLNPATKRRRLPYNTMKLHESAAFPWLSSMDSQTCARLYGFIYKGFVRPKNSGFPSQSDHKAGTDSSHNSFNGSSAQIAPRLICLRCRSHVPVENCL